MEYKCRGCFKDLKENQLDRISIFTPYKNQYNLSAIIFECIGLKYDKINGASAFICLECTDKLLIIHNFRAMYIETDKRFQSMFKSSPDAIMNRSITNDPKLSYYDEDHNLSLGDPDDILTEALSNVFGWDMFPAAPEAVVDAVTQQNGQPITVVDIDKNFYNMDIMADNMETPQMNVLNQTLGHGQSILSDITKIIAEENSHRISEIGLTMPLNADSWIPHDILDASDDTLNSFISSDRLSSISSSGPQSPTTSTDSQFSLSAITEQTIESFISAENLLEASHSPTINHIESINESMKERRKMKFVCNKCESAFSNMEALNRHLPLHDQKQTQCPHCPKAFSHASNLRRHLIRHNQTARFTCDFCNEIFSKSDALIEHLKVHSNAFEATNKAITTYVLECEMCGFKTLSYASFINHMRNNHPDADVRKVFKCRICGEGFCTKQGMFRHIDNIHENNRLNLRNQKKNFLCNLCGKSFFSNVQLIVHERTHNGDRPFKCNFCTKSFAQITGLKMHTYTHTGERPFICRICHKTFTQPGHLKEHLLLHEGLKPHVCSICKHSFRVKGNLTAHMLTHIGIQKPRHACNICSKHFPNRSKCLAHKVDCQQILKDKENKTTIL